MWNQSDSDPELSSERVPPATVVLNSGELFQKVHCLVKFKIKRWKGFQMAQKMVQILCYWGRWRPILFWIQPIRSGLSLPASVCLPCIAPTHAISTSSQEACHLFPLLPALSVFSLTFVLFQKNFTSWVSSLVQERYKAKWHQMMSPADGNDWTLAEPQQQGSELWAEPRLYQERCSISSLSLSLSLSHTHTDRIPQFVSIHICVHV